MASEFPRDWWLNVLVALSPHDVDVAADDQSRAGSGVDEAYVYRRRRLTQYALRGVDLLYVQVWIATDRWSVGLHIWPYFRLVVPVHIPGDCGSCQRGQRSRDRNPVRR